MTDREMLELAAKAAGLDDAWWQDMTGWGEVRHGFSHAVWSNKLRKSTGRGYWNPLERDGDAFRLMVDLRLDIEHNHPIDQQGWVAADRYGCEVCFSSVSAVEDDFDESGRAAATRRAIVRVAAEIGRKME